MFCIYLRTNSDLCHLQHKLIGFYNRDLTLYSPVVNIYTTSLTFNNCTLRPHCIYVFCIYLRTVNCATHNINWLDFISEMKSVYSAVRTGSLNKTVCTSSWKGYSAISYNTTVIKAKVFPEYCVNYRNSNHTTASAPIAGSQPALAIPKRAYSLAKLSTLRPL